MSASIEDSQGMKREVKGKKRKKHLGEPDPDGRDEENVKIQKKQFYTEADFKVDLRDPTTIYSGFEKFVQEAERWPGETEYDIVEGFLRSSSECSDVFQILETGKKKVQELHLIFQFFEKILLRIADDLDKYYTTGRLIVRQLLTTQLTAIHSTLNLRNKSSQIKSALKLLVAMVMLGPFAGKIVLNQIDLNHTKIRPLFFRRDKMDEEDIRTCMQHLIVAFLLASDSELTRRLASKKGLLAYVFQGIVFDRVPTIRLVLLTFLEKFVLNPAISKTTKVQIFTESTLKELGQLYNWKGPEKWKEKKGQKTEEELEEEDLLMDEDMKMDKQTVAEVAQKFLVELCCSHKFGICFMDSAYGTSGRNQNHILTSFLSYLSTISHRPLVQELIGKILEASPDQLKHFLPCMAHSLSPRATTKWVDSVLCLCKIYEAQPNQPHILMSKEHVPVDKIVDILLVHTLPTQQILGTVLPGVKNKSIAISHMSLAVVKVIAQKCVSILNSLTSTDCALRNVYNMEELGDITTAFKETVTKSLPDSSEIFHCLDRLKSEGISQSIDLFELCQDLQSDVMVRIEQVLCVYQDLQPTLLLDHPQGLVKLLEHVAMDSSTHLATGTQNEAEGQNEARKAVTETDLLPQLYLIKLLSGTDARRLPLGKESQSGHTLMYQLLSMVTQVEQDTRTREIALQLVCKLLGSTGLFDTFTEEIYIWMKHLQDQVCRNKNSSNLLTFVSKVIMTYMTNPYPYMDRVADLLSEAVAMKTGTATVHSVKDKLDRKIEEILKMDLDCLDSEDDLTSVSQMVARKQPFCPMLLTALDLILKMEEMDKTDLKEYLSSVILDVFHVQTDPGALCSLVKDVPDTCVVDGLVNYLNTWIPPHKVKKAKKQLLSITNKVQGRLMQYLLGSEFGTIEVTELEDIDLTLTSGQCLLYIKLLLEKDNTEESRSKLVHILAFLKQILSPDANKIESEADEQDDTTLPAEFSELEIKKPTGTQKLVEIYRMILESPIVKAWFLSEVDDSSPKKGNCATLSADVTEFVMSLFKFIKALEIGANLKEELSFYVDIVLKHVTHQRKSFSASDTHAVELLHHMLEFLDTENSINVLGTLLDVEGKSHVSDSIIDITCQILNSLCSQNVLMVRLSDNCVQRLVKLASSSAEPVLMDAVLNLLRKFPNLTVLCSEKNVTELVEKQMDTKLLEIIISNSVELRNHLETLFVKKPKLLTESGKQILPLVLTLLCYQIEPTAVVSCLQTAYMPEIFSFVEADSSAPETEAQSLIEILKHFIRLKVVEKKTFKKLAKILDTMLQSDSPLHTYHIQIIQMIHGNLATTSESHDQDGRRKLLVFCMQGLVKVVKEKDKRNSLVAKKIFEILDDFSEAEIKELGSHWEPLIENWPRLLKGCLKYFYTEPKALKLLTLLLPSLCETEQENSSISIETVVAMVTSHSSFLPVMFNEDSPEAKEPLLDLLIQLVTLRPSCCEKDHVGVYLGSYGATLSLTDQKILKLLHLYEISGVKLSDFRPFLWGEKAIEHQTLQKSMSKILLKEPAMDQVMENLQPERVAKTILNFPLRRKLHTLETKDAKEYKSLPDCYDPCFLLPLFSQLLAPAAVVYKKIFVQTNCLGMVFTALSSHDQAMRRAAYHVIERFKDHLEGAKFLEKNQIKYLLCLLKDSLEGSKAKLACTVTIFLARAAEIMLKPDDHMYGLINTFLLLKPSLDVHNVPEFYKLFNSSALEYKTERQWILSLLHDGLRETGDYRIFEKRYTFKLLQSFYDSDMSDISTQLKVLQILHSACRERSIAVDLVRHHGFLTWIAGAIQNLKPNAVEHVSHLVSIVNTLWLTFLENKKYQQKDDKQGGDKEESEMLEGEGEKEVSQEILKKTECVRLAVTSQVMTLCKTLLWNLRDAEVETLETVIDTLLSVLDHLKLTSSLLEENNVKCIIPTVHLIDLLLLLLHGGKLIPSQTYSSMFLKVIEDFGYDEDLLTPDKGDNAKVVKSGKNKNVNSVAAQVHTEEEVAEEAEYQDGDEKGVVDIGDKIEKVGDLTLVDNKENEAESSPQIVQKNVGEIIKIVTSYRIELQSNSERELAAVLAVISWCLKQLDHVDDIKVIGSLIRWLNTYSERNHLLINVIASSDAVSKDIFERLLNVYAKANSMIQIDSDSSAQLTQENLLIELNAVLVKVAALRMGIALEKSATVFSSLGKNLNSDACSSEEMKSLVLRKFFTRPEEDLPRKATDDDNSSGEMSVVEYQEFKVTPKRKALLASKTPDSKTAQAKRKSTNKKATDEMEESLHSQKSSSSSKKKRKSELLIKRDIEEKGMVQKMKSPSPKKQRK